MTAANRAVVVREVRPHDAQRLGEVVAEAYLAARILTEDDVYVTMLRDVAGRVAGAVAVLAAYDGAEVLGGLTLAGAGSPEAEVARDGELEIRMLGVGPQHQGRGVSAALLSASEDLGRTRGYEALILSSMEAMPAAQRLYRRYGFQRVPERDWQADWDARAVADGTAETLSVHRLPLHREKSA